MSDHNNLCPECKINNKRSWNIICYKCTKRGNQKTHWELEPCNVWANNKKIDLHNLTCDFCIERKKRRIDEYKFRIEENSSISVNLNSLSKKAVDKIKSYMRVSGLEHKTTASEIFNNQYYETEVIELDTNMNDFYYLIRNMLDENIKITARILMTKPVCYICKYFVGFNNLEFRELKDNLFAHNKCLPELTNPLFST